MGDIYTNPPQSRNEAILRATIDGTEYTAPPQSRIEDLLIELKAAIEQSGGGTTVVANPEGAATDEVKKLQVGSTVYAVEDEAGRGSSYQQNKDLMVAIPANSDLNNYKTAGSYYSASTANTATLSNCPITGSGFSLHVESVAGGTGQYIIQTLKRGIDESGVYTPYIYKRGCAGTVWGSWFKEVTDSSTKVDTSVIAPVENGAKASQRYTQGQHFQRNGDLYTVSTTIAENEDIVEGTNCVKEPYAIKNTLAGNIAEIMALVPAITDSAIAYIGSIVVGALTNNEITGVGGVIIISKVSATVHRWYGMCGNTYLAMGYITNGAYTSHRVIYRDTETEAITTTNANVTLDSTHKNAVKNGKTVNYMVRFTIEANVQGESAYKLFTMPYTPALQYTELVELIDITNYQRSGLFALISNSNNGFYIQNYSDIPAGTYEVGGTYICQ